MPAKRESRAVLSTQSGARGVAGRKGDAAREDSSKDDTDPLALTPLRSSSTLRSRPSRALASSTSGPSASISNASPTSTASSALRNARSSPLALGRSPGTKRTIPKSRLRSGRNTRVVGSVLGLKAGGEDLVEPSDDEEYEQWLRKRDTKTNGSASEEAEAVWPRDSDGGAEAESSRMAQERAEKQVSRMEAQTRSGSPLPLSLSSPDKASNHITFRPLFSPGRHESPPLETFSMQRSTATNSTLPLGSYYSEHDSLQATIDVPSAKGEPKPPDPFIMDVHLSAVKTPASPKSPGSRAVPERTPSIEPAYERSSQSTVSPAQSNFTSSAVPSSAKPSPLLEDDRQTDGEESSNPNGADQIPIFASSSTAMGEHSSPWHFVSSQGSSSLGIEDNLGIHPSPIVSPAVRSPSRGPILSQESGFNEAQIPSPMRHFTLPSGTSQRSPSPARSLAKERNFANEGISTFKAWPTTPSRHRYSTPDAIDLLDRRPTSPLTPSSPADATPIRRQQPISQPPVPVIVPEPAIDPALERFRTSRSFRTRTTLQLQPYTRERQIYEAALKKGGLMKGKHAIARPKSISPGDEDDEEDPIGDNDSQSAEGGEDDDPERIVIGGSDQQSIPQRRERKAIPILQEDKDDFILKFARQADEGDDDDRRALQGIAKTRLRAEKEDKRKVREARRLKKDFENLMREQLDHGDPSDWEHAVPAHMNREQQNLYTGSREDERTAAKILLPRHQIKTPGSKTTYGKSSRKQRARPDPSSESDASAILPAISPSAQTASGIGIQPARGTSPSLIPDTTSVSSLRQPDSPMDYAYGDDYGSHGQEDDFFVEDMTRSPAATSQQQRKGRDSSETDSDSSSAPQDKRIKIARRMLPAAMLKRLEEEHAAKERRRREEHKRNQHRDSPSPVRPGRAVVRRAGGGATDLFNDGLFDSVAGESSPARSLASSEPNSPTRARSRGLDAGAPIEISDSDMNSASDSQAEEDNGHGPGAGGGAAGAESLAQLYRGDFESIVTGKGRIANLRRQPRPAHRGQSTSRDGRHVKKNARPALGLAKRTIIPLMKGNKSMKQTRLDFPVHDDGPDSRPHSKSRQRASTHPAPPRSHPNTIRGPKPRPAIRMDDRTIFATDDFEFPDGVGEPHPISHKPEKPKPITSRPAKATVLSTTEALDEDVGKARSWAYLHKLSVDFGIAPLPTGLYCGPDTIPGSGRLVELLDIISGKDCPSIVPPSTSYGLELYQHLAPQAVGAVVHIAFARIHDAILCRANDLEASSPSFAPLRFLASYLPTVKDLEGADGLAANVSSATLSLSSKLDEMEIPDGKNGQLARQAVLDARWSLFDLSISLSSLEDGAPLVIPLAMCLLAQLLTTGFHRAIRPLRQIIKGESDSPEITTPALTMWISIIHVLQSWDHEQGSDGTFDSCLANALDSKYRSDQVGPIAAERIWCLVFGLCAVSQFDAHGRTSDTYTPTTRWPLVRKAISLIKTSHNEEAEEGAHADQLKGRDRYIRIMLARCTRLLAVWHWSFDRESFSIATKSLGMIFKERQYRNLPTEAPVDFPNFITDYNMRLTATIDTKRESAFELYLRLVCVAASDLISDSQSLIEAHQAEKDVQRLVMAIMPVSPVKFNRILPPTTRQLGQLINRYSTIVAATYFSPSLLEWLVACSKKWVAFEQADFDSRQVTIRGLMYVAVACRHHLHRLDPVVLRYAEILGILQNELDDLGKEQSSMPVQRASKLEVERTMVLVVTCIRQVISHGSFDPEKPSNTFPEPCLLHESWTTRVFALDLFKDLKCSTEVVATIQSYLEARDLALPAKARRAREEKLESQDEFGSLGFELDDITLARLGGGVSEIDEVQRMDDEFCLMLEQVICPKIYRLLSDMLPPVAEQESRKLDAERNAFLARLATCFSDCAAVLVIDHRKLDWSTFIGPFGKMSWSRLGDDAGRFQVGLRFMLNVATVDPGSFNKHQEEFGALILQTLVALGSELEVQFLEVILAIPAVRQFVLFQGVPSSLIEGHDVILLDDRAAALRTIMSNISIALDAREERSTARKPFFYRCLNILVSALALNQKSIHSARVLQLEEYTAFANTVVQDLRRIIGPTIVIPHIVPALKHFL